MENDPLGSQGRLVRHQRGDDYARQSHVGGVNALEMRSFDHCYRVPIHKKRLDIVLGFLVEARSRRELVARARWEVATCNDYEARRG